MHLELDKENNKLILTQYISHNEARSWFITRFLNFMTKGVIGK